MNLRIADLTKEGPKGIVIDPELTYITFQCIKPITIQSSEIQRVQIGVAFEVPAGYVLQISSHPKLLDQATEVFPALTIVDPSHRGELFLAAKNHGGNPLNLMPGMPIGRGYLVKIEQLEIEGFEFEASKLEPSHTKPKRKNPFTFEVK